MPKQEQAQSPNGVQLQSRKVNKGRLQVKELSGGKKAKTASNICGRGHESICGRSHETICGRA